MSQRMSWWQMPPKSWFKRRGDEDPRAPEPLPPTASLSPSPDDLFSPAGYAMQEARASTLKRHISALLKKLHLAEEEMRVAERRVADAAAAYTRALTDYTLHHEKQPPTYGWTRTMGYLLIMLVLFIFELPLNAVVFRIFQESEVLTVIFTAGISVVLLLCAHELGKLLRQRAHAGAHPENRAEHGVHVIFTLALLLLPLLIIFGIAYARSIYLLMLPESMQLLSPELVFLTFFAVNLAIFSLASFIAFGHYEHGLDLVAQAANRHRQAEDTLHRCRGYEDALKARLDSAWRMAHENRSEPADLPAGPSDLTGARSSPGGGTRVDYDLDRTPFDAHRAPADDPGDGASGGQRAA